MFFFFRVLLFPKKEARTHYTTELQTRRQRLSDGTDGCFRDAFRNSKNARVCRRHTFAFLANVFYSFKIIIINLLFCVLFAILRAFVLYEVSQKDFCIWRWKTKKCEAQILIFIWECRKAKQQKTILLWLLVGNVV